MIAAGVTAASVGVAVLVDIDWQGYDAAGWLPVT
jgi:hypothetical protein